MCKDQELRNLRVLSFMVLDLRLDMRLAMCMRCLPTRDAHHAQAIFLLGASMSYTLNWLASTIGY